MMTPHCSGSIRLSEWPVMVLEDYDGLLADRLRDWRPDHIGTLVFLLADGRVLLMRKKRGHGAGRINGPATAGSPPPWA